MTEDEKTMACALNACCFCPGIGTKRFARSMAYLADMQDDQPITARQSKYLRDAVIRFRRQIPADVVAIARAE